MPAVTRKQYKGAAAQTTITSTLSSLATTVSIAATTGWPDGATPFFVVISPGTAAEEKCLVTRSGSTLTLTRAQDDTTAQSHSSGATIYPVFTATDANEANAFNSALTTRGDLLTMDSSVNPTRVAIGSAGSILRSNGTDPSWLALGSAGAILRSDGSAPSWLSAGTNGTYLQSTGTGLQWATIATVTGEDDQIVLSVQVFS